MTTTELLDIAAAQIAHVDTRSSGRYGLFVTDKQLHCQPLRDRQPTDLLIAEFNMPSTYHGMTSREWDQLEAKLRKLQQEGLL